MAIDVLGIDPGAATGLALYCAGRLTGLETIAPFELERFIRSHEPKLIVFEDSRLISHLWGARQKKDLGAQLAAARSVGQVDAWCSLIAHLCADMRIQQTGISPKVKGAKLDAKVFAQLTGWRTQCNQHERDAAMVAWPFRGYRGNQCGA